MRLENGRGFMANSVKEIVMDHLAPVVEDMGFELVEVEYVKKPNGMNLTLLIDSPNGVDLDALEKVHRVVDEKLDEIDPTNGAPYILNCSSLGLDRPLKTDKDLNRNIGQMIEVSLYLKLEGAKDHVGTLISFDEKSVTINTNNKEISLPKESISKIKKHIIF